MPDLAVTVRQANVGDADAIAPLTTQLGYPTDASATRRRLERLLKSDRDAVLLADRDGRVVGWIHVGLVDSLENDTVAAIHGLVVDKTFRSHGIGAMLLKAGEEWARDNGVHRIRLRSNIIRDRAHAFYERAGYAKVKQQFTFEKKV